MSGNYGGSSIPTTPIGGTTLYDSRATAYKNWACTTIVASAGTATFTIGGVSYSLDQEGASIDLLVRPGQLTAAPVGVYFLCYDCSCNSPMTGITDASVSVYYSGGTASFAPTFIGGGNLNN